MKIRSICLAAILIGLPTSLGACSDDDEGGGSGGGSGSGATGGGSGGSSGSATGGSSGSGTGGSPTGGSAGQGTGGATGGTAGQGGAAGQGAAAGAGGSAGAAECPVSSTACSTCRGSNCAKEFAACNADQACNSAGPTSGQCVCAAQLQGDAAAVAQCIATLEATNEVSKAIGECMLANCKTDCGL